MAKNGGKRPGAGRKKGSKLPQTLEREKVQEAFNQRVFGVADKLFQAQFATANGTHKIIVMTRDAEGHPHVETVRDEERMESLLATGEYGKDYMIVAGSMPNNQAIDSLLNRGLGKPKETVEHQGLEFLFDEKTD